MQKPWARWEGCQNQSRVWCWHMTIHLVAAPRCRQAARGSRIGNDDQNNILHVVCDIDKRQVPDSKVATWETNSINVSAYQIATLTGRNTFCCHALVIRAVCLDMAGCGSSSRLNGHIWNCVRLYMNNIAKYAQTKKWDGVSILLHECDEQVTVGQVDLWLWSEILDGMLLWEFARSQNWL